MSGSGMKVVERKHYMRVLCQMDVGSIAIAVNGGLKLDDIKEMEIEGGKGKKDGTKFIRVVTEGHLMNLRVKANLIDWEWSVDDL